MEIGTGKRRGWGGGSGRQISEEALTTTTATMREILFLVTTWRSIRGSWCPTKKRWNGTTLIYLHANLNLNVFVSWQHFYLVVFLLICSSFGFLWMCVLQIFKLVNINFSHSSSGRSCTKPGEGEVTSFFFRHNSKKLAIDATAEDDTFGRLINHSSRAPNVGMKIVKVDRIPVIVFIALKPIKTGQEIQYDYGEKRKEVLEQNPWLK